MKLPRSVQEISAENFKPRRCESNMFRGFSYIQEDFVLPERSVSGCVCVFQFCWINVHVSSGDIPMLCSVFFFGGMGWECNSPLFQFLIHDVP